MPFKIFYSNFSTSIENELNEFAQKNNIIKHTFFKENGSYSVLVEYSTLNNDRANKILSLYDSSSEDNYQCSMVEWIHKMFDHSFKKEWYITYWAFDIHGTVLMPNHRKLNKEAIFYPYAEETLQLLTKRDDIKLILYTSSYPEEIDYYQDVFKEKNIFFDYINENPEIDSTKGNFGYYVNKFYFNVLFEDKAGFNPIKDWQPVYKLLNHYDKIKYFPNPSWSTKY